MRRPSAAARQFLADDLLFIGLFETYRSTDEYLAALTKLLQVVVRLAVQVIIAEGNDTAVFFKLETRDPAAATTPMAECTGSGTGRSLHVKTAVDGRPFASMFGG